MTYFFISGSAYKRYFSIIHFYYKMSLLLDELFSEYSPSWMKFAYTHWMYDKKCRPDKMFIKELNAMASYAAKNNHTHLFHLAARWYQYGEKGMLLEAAAAAGNIPFIHRTRRTLRNCNDRHAMNYILSSAAENGHENILRMIHDWDIDEIDYRAAVRGAARGGHIHLIVLVLGWGVPYYVEEIKNLLAEGATHGHEAICRFAKSQGATNWSSMLRRAANVGNEYLCRLAKRWAEEAGEPFTPHDYDQMYWGLPSDSDNKNNCDRMIDMALEWGANDYGKLLIRGIAAGDERIFRLALAKNGGVIPHCFNYNPMIKAIEMENTHFCTILKDHGYCDWGPAINEAVCRKNDTLYQLIRGWANDCHDVKPMLKYALDHGQTNLFQETMEIEEGSIVDWNEYMLLVTDGDGYRLAKDHGATNSNELLLKAILNNNEPLGKIICESNPPPAGLFSAHEWDAILVYEASTGRYKKWVYEYAKQYGATNFKGMLRAATTAKNYECSRLAIKWGARRTQLEFKYGV